MFNDALWSPEGMVADLYGDAGRREAALTREPGFHNWVGLERAWADEPLAMDFLAPGSPHFWTKQFSTRLYADFFEPHLSRYGADAAALDAGCGIGRFTAALAARYKRVVAFDPCRSSLVCCRDHLAADGASNVELHWADLSWLDENSAPRFDLVLAVELICYVQDPPAALRRLVRVCRPGATMLLSVEGRPGALAVQGCGAPADLSAALSGKPLQRDGDRFVIFFDEQDLRQTLVAAGLRDIEIAGSHYLAEGPFWQSLDDARLADPAYFESALAVEKWCRAQPTISPWARVFMAAGRV